MPHTYVVCFIRLHVNEKNSCDLPLYFERALIKNKQVLFEKKFLNLNSFILHVQGPTELVYIFTTFKINSEKAAKVELHTCSY